MGVSNRTLVAWVDGERFVFREEQVDEVLDRGTEADTPDEAWDALAAYGREIANA